MGRPRRKPNITTPTSNSISVLNKVGCSLTISSHGPRPQNHHTRAAQQPQRRSIHRVHARFPVSHSSPLHTLLQLLPATSPLSTGGRRPTSHPPNLTAARSHTPPMAAAADDLARRLAAFIPLPQPPQKEQLSGVAAAVLDAGGRLGRAVGDVFRRLRIDDGLDVAFAQRRRRNGGSRIAAAAAVDARVSKDSGGGGVDAHDPVGVSGRFARSQART